VDSQFTVENCKDNFVGKFSQITPVKKAREKSLHIFIRIVDKETFGKVNRQSAKSRLAITECLSILSWRWTAAPAWWTVDHIHRQPWRLTFIKRATELTAQRHEICPYICILSSTALAEFGKISVTLLWDSMFSIVCVPGHEEYWFLSFCFPLPLARSSCTWNVTRKPI
jgi:hypothetical protein